MVPPFDIGADQLLDVALFVVYRVEFADDVGVVFLVQFEMILSCGPFVVAIHCFGVTGAHFLPPKYPIMIVKAISKIVAVMSGIPFVLFVLFDERFDFHAWDLRY